MKKITIFIVAVLMVLACISTAIAANWVLYDRFPTPEYPKGITRCYADISSIKRTGNNTFKIISKDVDENGTYTECREFKIKKSQSRTLYYKTVLVDGTLAASSNKPDEWYRYSSDSPWAKLYKVGVKHLSLK